MGEPSQVEKDCKWCGREHGLDEPHIFHDGEVIPHEELAVIRIESWLAKERVALKRAARLAVQRLANRI